VQENVKMETSERKYTAVARLSSHFTRADFVTSKLRQLWLFFLLLREYDGYDAYIFRLSSD